jgi:hypothetical protein
MGSSGPTQLGARVKARERRVALLHDQFAREQRIQAAMGAAGKAAAQRDCATSLVRAAELRIGLALSAMLADGLTTGDAARLCSLSCGEVRRLRRAAQETHICRANPRGSEADPGRAPQAPLQAMDSRPDWPPEPASGPAAPEQPGVVAHPR